MRKIEWINVNDRVPEKAGLYLVSLHKENEETGEEDDIVLLAWYNPISPLFCEQEMGWCLLNEFYNLTERLREYITHWMPVPEPPTKEKDYE